MAKKRRNSKCHMAAHSSACCMPSNPEDICLNRIWSELGMFEVSKEVLDGVFAVSVDTSSSRMGMLPRHLMLVTRLHRDSVTSECPWKGLLRKVGVTGTDPPPLTELAGKRNRSTRRYAADVLGWWLTATVLYGRTKRSGGDSCMGIMESMEFHLLVGHPICTPGTILEDCGLHDRHPEGLRMEGCLHVCGS